MCTGDDGLPGSVAEALRMATASMDYLNGPVSALTVHPDTVHPDAAPSAPVVVPVRVSPR